MRLPFWLLRLLPMWDYLCPKCRSKVKQKSHKCPYCGENYGTPLRVPPKVLKEKKALSDYVHKHIFPKVSQVYRDYLTQFFTEIFSDGFESGDFSAWTGSGGSPSVVENPYQGTYSLKRDDEDDRVYKYLPSSYTVIYGRLYWQTDTLPTTDTKSMIFRFYSPPGTYFYLIYENDAGTYNWKLQSTEASDSDTYTQTINVDTWYCLEVLYDADNDLHKLWVDGVERISFSASVTTAIERCGVGAYLGSWWTHNEYADCVVVADAYIGPEAEVTVKTVTDSLSLTDSVLRNKTFSVSDAIGLSDMLLRNKTLVVTDSVGANDAVLGNKSPLIVADAVSLSELINVITEAMLKTVTDQVSLSDGAKVLKQLGVSDAVTLVDGVNVTERILRVLDAVVLADTLHVNKFLQVTEAISLAEVVQVGVGGVKKTKLFLILGELAVQLTGD
jgi:hypothetical protein